MKIKMLFEKLRKVIRPNKVLMLLFISLPIVLGLVVLYRFISPLGLSVNYNFNIADNAELFGKIRDVDRSSFVDIQAGDINFKDKFDITKEKVEFSVQPLVSDIKTIKFNIGLGEINNPSLLLQVSNFKAKNTENYIVYNRDLNDFGTPDYEYNGFNIWAFNKEYSTVESLSKTIDEFAQTGNSISTCTLGNSFTLEPVLSTVKSLENEKTFPQILRGSHVFSAYVGKDGKLFFAFDKIDLNWYAGLDDANVKVSKGDVVLSNQTIADDGIYDGKFGRPLGESVRYTIDMDNLTEGVYQINIQTTEDVLLEHLATKNQKLVVNKDIFIVNNQLYGVGTTTVEINTFAPRLFITSYHDSSKQKVIVNKNTNTLENLQSFESFELDSNILNNIVFTESDVRISSKDYYSLDDSSYFKPTVADGINCLSFPKDVIEKQDILAIKNLSTKNEDGTYTVEIPYNSDFIFPDNKVYLTLYSPGLGIDQSKIEVKSLNIQMLK